MPVPPTAGIAPTPSDTPVGQQKKGAVQSVATIPFARSSKWHIEQSNVQSGIVLTGASSQIFNFPLASYGYLSAVFLTINLTGGSGAGTSNTFFEDSPYSMIQQIQLSDVNGVPIFQLSGFNAFLAAKYGGYRLFSPDGGIFRGAPFDTNAAGAAVGTPQQAAVEGGPVASLALTSNATNYGAYSFMPNGGSATGLNCKFVIPIYLEFGLDGLGCLPNMDASARYNLQVTVAGGIMTASNTGPFLVSGTVGTAPTMTINVEVLCRSQPPAQDMFGNMNSVSPPAVGTVQYWTSQTASGLSTGQNTIQLTRVGNLIRHHILVFRNATTSVGPRGLGEVTDMPSTLEFDWDVGQRYVANVSSLRYLNGYGVYGLGDANGCITLPNTLDPDKVAISEYGDEWLATVGATKFTLRFNPGGTGSGGSVTVLTNDIVPSSGQVYQAPQLSLS